MLHFEHFHPSLYKKTGVGKPIRRDGVEETYDSCIYYELKELFDG
jgi:hypothetical protein